MQCKNNTSSFKTPVDTLRSINAAGAHNLVEAHFEQSAGHQETPPIA